jgi:hypothetical protein
VEYDKRSREIQEEGGKEECVVIIVRANLPVASSLNTSLYIASACPLHPLLERWFLSVQ